MGVGVYDATHEVRECCSGVALIGHGILHSSSVDSQAIGGEPQQEILLDP
jgi:hypothetical protein